MIRQLVKLADYLDKKGLHKEADYLDKVISKYSAIPLAAPAALTMAESLSVSLGINIYLAAKLLELWDEHKDEGVDYLVKLLEEYKILDEETSGKFKIWLKYNLDIESESDEESERQVVIRVYYQYDEELKDEYKNLWFYYDQGVDVLEEEASTTCSFGQSKSLPDFGTPEFDAYQNYLEQDDKSIFVENMPPDDPRVQSKLRQMYCHPEGSNERVIVKIKDYSTKVLCSHITKNFDKQEVHFHPENPREVAAIECRS